MLPHRAWQSSTVLQVVRPALVAVTQKLCSWSTPDLSHFVGVLLFINMEEKLIELVRNYPVLYDTSNFNYMKTMYKQEILKKIGRELKLVDDSGEDVKSAWKKLRTNHRDALRRRKRMKKVVQQQQTSNHGSSKRLDRVHVLI
ncbi:hypothetical protein J6590_081552 [Homalodisca vitripennis]|nr:hypothetical protein J6590_081552 [Homalodisca vitripennis]